VIIEMSSEHAVRHPARMRHREIKWSRGLRVTVALAGAVVSWGALFGAGYLIAQIF
jgi:hypothetical protein